MGDEAELADHSTPSFEHVKEAIKEPEFNSLNPGLMVLLLVGGLVLTFLIGNYTLYMYAQKTLPTKKKKPISKKKMKREKLRQGVAPPGE